MILSTLLQLSPVLVMLGAALWILIDDLLANSSRQASRTAATGAIFSFVCVVLVASSAPFGADSLHPYVREVLVFDKMALVFQGVIAMLTFFTALLSYKSFAEEERHSGEYYTMLLFVSTGEMLAVASTELLTFFVCFELLSLPLYMLAAFRRYDPRSAEAGLKYFLTGALSSALLLYGFSWIYGCLGTTVFAEFAPRIQQAVVPGQALLVGLVLVIAGLAFKVAAAPFHNWAPDVYDGAPPAVVAYLSSAPKVAMTAVLLRLFWVNLDVNSGFSLSLDWASTFAALGLISMTVGNLAAIPQTRIPRMLAYSGIAHIGYLMLGLAACSRVSAGTLGIAACIYYVTAYSVANLAAWGVLVVLDQNRSPTPGGPTPGGDGQLSLANMAGVAQLNPFLGFVMLISLMSLAGVPPLAGFVGKFYVFRALFAARMPMLVLIGILNSVISLYYYFKVLRAMYFQEPERSEPIYLSGRQRLVLGACVLTILIIGLWPGVAQWAVTAAPVLP